MRTCVRPAMTYGAKTWTLRALNQRITSSRKNKVGKEYVKHHISGQKKNIIREHFKTTVTGVIEQVRRRKRTWVGLVSRLRDNR